MMTDSKVHLTKAATRSVSIKSLIEEAMEAFNTLQVTGVEYPNAP